MTCVSLASVVMFLAPWLASCLPLTASSCWLIVISKPGTLICDSASATPFAVGTPFGASPPVMGSSIPTLMAVAGPPAAALPAGALDEPVVAAGVPAGVLLHPAAKRVAAASAAPTRANFMYSSSKLPTSRAAALPKADAAPAPLVAGVDARHGGGSGTGTRDQQRSAAARRSDAV